MSYFIENWFRGEDADFFRQNFSETGDLYYPHITLVRPFSLRSSEREVKQLIIDVCRGRSPIPFSLEGGGSFDEVRYIPVLGQELLQFADELESVLEPKVIYVPKLDEQRTLHLTVNALEEVQPFPRTDFHMLRLTTIRNKKIWFSCDLVTGEVLNREQTLDRSKWVKKLGNFMILQPNLVYCK